MDERESLIPQFSLSEQLDAAYDPLVGDRINVNARVKQSHRGVDVPQCFFPVAELAF